MDGWPRTIYISECISYFVGLGSFIQFLLASSSFATEIGEPEEVGRTSRRKPKVVSRSCHYIINRWGWFTLVLLLGRVAPNIRMALLTSFVFFYNFPLRGGMDGWVGGWCRYRDNVNFCCSSSCQDCI